MATLGVGLADRLANRRTTKRHATTPQARIPFGPQNVSVICDRSGGMLDLLSQFSAGFYNGKFKGYFTMSVSIKSRRSQPLWCLKL